MGRLSQFFAGKPITWRSPNILAGELLVLPNVSGQQFSDDAFSNQTDKPMEIHRMIIRLTAMAEVQYPGQASVVLQPVTPQPDTLGKLIRLSIDDFSKNQKFTKRATLVNSFLSENRQTWEWEEPYTIVRSEGLRVSVDSLDFPSVCAVLDGDTCAEPSIVPISQVRVEISLEGYNIVIAAPTETR